MQLITNRQSTEVMHVLVPIKSRNKSGFTASEFGDAMRSCVGDWERVCLRDGITVGADALHEYIEDQNDNDHIGQKLLNFLQAVVALEPPPDEYFFHL